MRNNRKTEIAKFTPTERVAYEESLKNYRDIKNVVDTSLEEGRELGRKEGLKQGLEQGIEQGLEQGIEQGLERGKQETKNEIAKKMKDKGLPIATIVELTNLSEEEIGKI